MTASLGTADRDTAAGGKPGPSALAAEHTALLEGATERTADITAVLDVDRWPQSELGALVGFLRTTLLRQASDEEVRLFPPDPSAPPFAELAAEHTRLRALTTQVARVYDD